jgi:competence protein ComEA
VTISPSLAAVGGASLVAVVVAFVLRPVQLAPHPSPELSLPRESVHAPAPASARPQTMVYVAGAVAHPGVYVIAPDARAKDALAKAGGATLDADLVAVNLAAHVADGDEIAVPHQGDVLRAASAARSAHRRTAGAAHVTRRRPRRAATNAGSAEPESAQVVDINTAGADALAQLPGIGPTLAERIVEFRTLNGPFASVDGLADVAGITAQRLDALTPSLTAGR